MTACNIFVALENEPGTIESDKTSSVTQPEWERERVQIGKLLNALTRISSVLQNQDLDRVSMWQVDIHTCKTLLLTNTVWLTRSGCGSMPRSQHLRHVVAVDLLGRGRGGLLRGLLGILGRLLARVRQVLCQLGVGTCRECVHISTLKHEVLTDGQSSSRWYWDSEI